MAGSPCSVRLYLSCQVAKQWCDFERSSFLFVKLVKELKSPLTCRRVSDFDDNGMFYWIGSNAKWVTDSFGWGRVVNLMRYERACLRSYWWQPLLVCCLWHYAWKPPGSVSVVMMAVSCMHVCKCSRQTCLREVSVDDCVCVVRTPERKAAATHKALYSIIHSVDDNMFWQLHREGVNDNHVGQQRCIESTPDSNLIIETTSTLRPLSFSPIKLCFYWRGNT